MSNNSLVPVNKMKRFKSPNGFDMIVNSKYCWVVDKNERGEYYSLSIGNPMVDCIDFRYQYGNLVITRDNRYNIASITMRVKDFRACTDIVSSIIEGSELELNLLYDYSSY